MSTHCMIWKKENRTYTGIYCHHGYDAIYIRHILTDWYNSAEKVNALIELGNISLLQEKIAPDAGECHSFGEPANHVTVAYHRDRGEELFISTASSLTEVNQVTENHSAHHIYLYDCEKNQWLWKTTCRSKFTPI